jgi:hypothetical protein
MKDCGQRGQFGLKELGDAPGYGHERERVPAFGWLKSLPGPARSGCARTRTWAGRSQSTK